MKNIYTLFLSVCISLSALGQIAGDTIVVSSLDYNATTRDTIVSFPNLPNVTFEKILMRYNMRCKGALVSNQTNRNQGCGEWDYSCNTFITDSTKADSTEHTTNNYLIPGFVGSTLDYNTTAIQDYHRMIQPNVNVNSITSETQALIGAGNSNIPHTVPTMSYGAKSQYLYTSTELLAAGATAGNLDGILLDVNTAGLNASFLKVKIKNSTKTQLSASTPDTNGFTEVFFHNTNFTVGSNRLQFNTPFAWNGTSNIIVEFSFTNASNGANNVVFSGTATTNTMGIHSQEENLFYFKNDNYIEADNYNGIGGSQARTVEAWIKTTVADKEICSWGRNAANVKWVFRLDNAGRLRVENGNGGIVGTTALNDDKWHHVACTFNGTTLNDVKLYADGQLETNSSNSGTAINTDVVGGVPLRISRGVNNRYFEGHIDNVRIWDTELSATTLQDWMHKKINLTHPNAASLKAYYLINAGSGSTITDQSGLTNHASVINGAIWQTTTGEQHFKDFLEEGERPNLTFVQGTYVTTLTNDTTWLAIDQIPLIVRQTTITAYPGTLLDDEISYGPALLYWNTQPGERYYDENNTLLQTTPVTASANLTISPIPFVRRDAMQFDIMSFVTPYGIGLDLGPDGKTWTFDVTDFSPILKGDKRMLMTFGGQWQEEMDIKFLFIVGTPPQEVKDINNIWKSIRSSNYQSINSDAVFPPRNIALDANASSFKIRSTITGHGQDGEFIPRNHHLNIDGGATEYTWSAWKECADNPVYPQGGTWIYDRAGWCPGMATDLQQPYIDQYVTPGQTHSFDYDVDVASGDSRYIVSHQLVNYGAPNHALDVRITDILNPSTRVEFARENPICKSPKVRIQNTGSTPLTSVKIEYGLNGVHQLTKAWTGSLDFMESEIVELDAPTWFWEGLNGPTGNTFYAEVIEPNAGTDEYDLNNKMTSHVEIPAVLPNEFILIYKANSAFNETKIEIFDESGTAIFSKIATNTSISFDTIKLNNGCHSLLISDNDDDGISFWANNDGSGVFFLRDYNNTSLFTLDGDFGKYYRYNFTVNFPLSYEEMSGTFNAKIYPNPTNDILYIDAEEIEKSKLEIFDALGKKVQLPIGKEANKVQLNTSTLANGFYFVKMELGNKRSTKKFLIQH